MRAALTKTIRESISIEELTQAAAEEIAAYEKNSANNQTGRAEKDLATLNAQIDKIYADRLSGLLAEEDFRRVYEKKTAERERLSLAAQKNSSRGEQTDVPSPRELAEKFMMSCDFADLIEKIEVSEGKELIIRLFNKTVIL